MFGKQNKVRVIKGIHTTKEALGYTHSNIWEPSPTQYVGGNNYFLSLVDDLSIKVWNLMLKNKDKTFVSFK